MNNYSIDYNNWSKLNIFEQMGNIYVEVSRTFDARMSNNKDREILSIIRAIDLFNLTAKSLVHKKSIKLKEVLRVKDQYLNNLYSDTFDENDSKSLEKYLLQYAIAARINR